MTALPTIALGEPSEAADRRAADAIDTACRDHGFFLVRHAASDDERFDRLEAAARAFFALPLTEKERIAMPLAGRRWRGWFPPGGELTSGVPDGKEGIYFGAEHASDHPRVVDGTPLHGANLFPERPTELRELVLGVMGELTELGHRLMALIAIGLGLPEHWFRHHLTADPTVLFRIFHYPASSAVPEAAWGVQEHTDYGLLTILRQDDVGGLEVRTEDRWIEVPADPGSFVCNIGDMLERMTGGTYRSTAHRVRRPSRSRLSFPFFFDPSWDAHVVPITDLPSATANTASAPDTDRRWDGRSVFDHDGTYGDYLTAKVARVFPRLWDPSPPGEGD